MKEKILPFTVKKKKKKELTSTLGIQEIPEIFVTLVLVRSRKYFQLFCFNPCPFTFIKELTWHK